MTEYGRIHTDGSRSGGQPVLLPCPFCGKQPWSYDDANHSTAWEVECGNTTCSAQPSVWKTTKVEAIAAWNTRQPTQSDALREENERLRAVLARTVNLAEVYAEGTGTNFKEAMAEARAALQEQSK